MTLARSAAPPADVDRRARRRPARRSRATRRVHGQLAVRLRRRQGAVEAGALDQSVVDDIGWARYPRVDAGQPSAPPLGGINLAIGAFTKHPDQASRRSKCITSLKNQS